MGPVTFAKKQSVLSTGGKVGCIKHQRHNTTLAAQRGAKGNLAWVEERVVIRDAWC